MPDEPGIVCWMTPDGNVICSDVFESADCAPLAMFVAASDSEPKSSRGKSKKGEAKAAPTLPAGEWGPNKTELACRILEVLGSSKLPDELIPRRSGEVVDTVARLMGPVPPSIMLYNYSTQPANVMGAYYLNKADLVNMQRMYEVFKNPKQP